MTDSRSRVRVRYICLRGVEHSLGIPALRPLPERLKWSDEQHFQDLEDSLWFPHDATFQVERKLRDQYEEQYRLGYVELRARDN